MSPDEKFEYDISDGAGEYTLSAIDNLFDEFDAEEVAQQLKNNEEFRTFDEGLTDVLITSGYTGDIYSVSEKTKYLLSAVKDAGGSLSRPTVHDWLTGKRRPKCNSEGREKMFLLCFALHMDLAKTISFFRKVYFDQPFNFRNSDECIYYYCLKTRKSYGETKRLKQYLAEKRNKQNFEPELSDHTIFVRDRLEQIETESELIEYLALNIPKNSLYYQTAREYITILRDEAIELAKRENTFFKKQFSGRTGTGTDFLLKVIYSGEYKTLIEDKEITELVRRNFPRKMEFSMAMTDNENVTADLMRKCLILLLFYNTYVKITLEDVKEDFNTFERFYSESSNVLNECGFAPLYPLNPYDRIFLKTAAGNSDYRIDGFRQIIDALSEAEED